MPRIARQVENGGVYHLLNRGNARQKVFHRDADYLAFEELLRELQQRFSLTLYAYCLMPNHFHLVVKAEQGGDLAPGMQWFTTTFVRRHHRYYRSSGHLWQGRYKSFDIEDDDHLLTVVRYIEGNPVRAGLVGTASDWNWSSHQQRARGLTPQVPLGTGSVRCLSSDPESSNSKELKGLAPQVPVPGTGHKDTGGKRSLISELPITLPQPWTEYVDTPMTGKELTKVKKKLK